MKPTPLIVHQRRLDRWLVVTKYRTVIRPSGKKAYVPLETFDVSDQIQRIVAVAVATDRTTSAA